MTAQESDRDRLMKFPKGVLVDYFLRRHLFSIDWRQLELSALIARQRDLIARADRVPMPDVGASVAEWRALNGKWDSIQKQIDRTNKKIDELLGVGDGKRPDAQD